MKASLINKNGFTFDSADFDTKEDAIAWAKNRGNCHLSIEVDEEKGFYRDYKVTNNKAHFVEV